MKLETLMKQAIDEDREMIIHDGYNNLYRLVPVENDDKCLMYEHYSNLKTIIDVGCTYDIISNDLYEELKDKE